LKQDLAYSYLWKRRIA